jgi:uncharacterized protein involved in exopolysaccharide biosynthesis
MTNAAPDGRAHRNDELTLVGAAEILLRRPRLVVAYPLAVAVVATALTYVVQPTFVSTAAFAPEVRSATSLPSGLATLATQFGVGLQGQATQSPAFYVTVLRTRQLAEQVLLSRFPDPRSPTGRDSIQLLALMAVPGATHAESVAVGVKRLLRTVSTSVDARSGVVRLSVESRWPSLAAQIATRLVENVNQFNATQRQSQARERRIFVQNRVAEFEGKLEGAEMQLRRFYETNRSWQQSPQLALEEQRLRRDIDLVRDIFVTLQREYELARIEEVNDTPVLTIVDPAVPAVRKSRPQRAKTGVAVLVVGVLIGVFAAFVADYLERVRRERVPEPADLTGLTPTGKSL